MRATIISGLCAAGLLIATPGLAQEAQAELKLRKPAARQGYYIGGGLRQGLGGGHADNAGSLGFQRGFGFAFRFGQMATDALGFGLVIGAGGSANSTWRVGGGHLALEAMYKPLDDYDLALRGGIGFGGLGLTRAEEDQEREDDPSGGIGTYYSLGASMDLFPWYEPKKYESGGFAFTGFTEISFLPTSEIWTMNFVIGLEVTYWFGLTKDKLDLPASEAFKFEDDD